MVERMIFDSGNRRTFDSGAVRDVQDGKGRCDLLPLDIVHEIFAYSKKNPIDKACDEYTYTFNDIDNYIRTGDRDYLFITIIDFCKIQKSCSLETMFLEVSKHYEEGAEKYTERNWEKGIPLHCFIDSAVRHYLKFLRGDNDERHDRAFVWNILGALWTHANKPELIDLPFIDNKNS